MRAILTPTTAILYREPEDPPLYKETLPFYRLKLLLNKQGYHFTRYNPSRFHLTSCQLGLRDPKIGILLWHERYQIELAHEAFNSGKLTLQRLDY